MKNKTLTNIAFACFLLAILPFKNVIGQSTDTNKKSYTTTGGEMIFSWAQVKKGGEDATAIVRWSPVFNFQFQYHNDFSSRAGFFTGVNIRNVGFIFDDPTTVNTRYKARVYDLGVPVALKLGNMRGLCLFGGYEIEFPFNYKEKRFVNEVKEEKNTSWFSSKVPSYYQSFFFGVQTAFGAQLKFKYYMTNFFNKNYSADDGAGNVVKPYANIDANVLYISLSFQVLKGAKAYHKDK